jgi:ATP-dependent RNA helicase DeaD
VSAEVVVKTAAVESSTTFTELGLSAEVLRALVDVGYESPSPIQAATIPVLLEGRDLLGQAQTGTGKTAAFALPILSKLDLAQRHPQALVMVPTRELAIQVAEAFQKYAAHLRGFHVLPIYGGQSYVPQLNALKRGTHVIVGTPGRIIDHLDRGTLSLDGVRHVVLDEADEMLAMGFVDAIETILNKVPPQRQVALFSATMAHQIKAIAQRHLRSPAEINIRNKTSTSANLRQRYWLVSGMHKLDALTRILEVEPFDAMLIFARTKQATEELAEKLSARGFAASALNGDMQQAHRERTVQQLKGGQIDILVATDVAARGLDVERIGHVVNFDIPYDTESYIHRVGRTGRAGRNGEAILFVAPRERRMLALIERATRGTIEPMNLPSVADVNSTRVKKFRDRVLATMATSVPGGATNATAQAYRAVVEELVGTGNDALDVAAALAVMAQGKVPLLLGEKGTQREERSERPERGERFEHGGRSEREARPGRGESAAPWSEGPPRRRGSASRDPQQTYRLAVGLQHGVQPGNIVGAICNEANLDGSQINGIRIEDDHSFVRLPEGLPESLIARLQKVRVRGQLLAITPVGGAPLDDESPQRRHAPPHRGQPFGMKRKPKPKPKPPSRSNR